MENLVFLTKEENEARNKFLDKFSPEKIKKISNLELLKILAFPKNQNSNKLREQFKELYEENYDSLKNQLENKNDSFGSGHAGSDTNFLLAFRKDSWHNLQKEISLEEAINIAEKIKSELIIANDFLKEEDFNSFYKYAINSKINLFNRVYIHKYFYILHPKFISFFHALSRQNFYKEKLGLKGKSYYEIEKYFIEKEINYNLYIKSKELINDYGEPQKEKQNIINNEIKNEKNNKIKETKQPLNQILYGPPGTGKTYSTKNLVNNIIKNQTISKDKSCKFITFHQSYSYEEFIEGIKPIVDGNNKDLKYEIAKGIFKKLCLEANKDKENKYVLVIDEINRGNISKIFGELITLIEDDKRVEPNGEDDFENTQVKDNELLVTLPYLKQKFGVPKNLYIIGTMNTSDRSIASVDIALRRRFKFIEMMPQKNLVADFGIEFNKVFENLNNKIRILLDRDHQIGHSYFINTKYNDENGNNNIEILKNIWFSEILPLLNEYFYNDWDKLNLIVPGFIKKLEIPECLKNEYEKAYEFATIDDFENDSDFKNALLKEPKEDINEI